MVELTDMKIPAVSPVFFKSSAALRTSLRSIRVFQFFASTRNVVPHKDKWKSPDEGVCDVFFRFADPK